MNRNSFLALAALASFVVTPGQAQETIDVPAQPLAAALAELGAETGFQVLAPAGLVRGKTSAAVSGQLTPDAALQRLLTGTGLSFTRSNGGAIITQAASQGSGLDGELVGEDIIVQGELQTRSLQDTQTSVAVIRGDDLERRSDPDLFTVIERTPGVTIAGGSDIGIRGVPAFGFAAGRGNGRAIATVVDGAPLSNLSASTQRVAQSTWDLEQIEVLRGPQSTQTGRNALFGAVNIQSRDPSFDTEFKFRGELANFETLGGAFAVNLPWEDQGLALRLSADLQRSEGFIENATLGTDDDGASQSATIRAALLFEPTDAFSANLKFFRVESEIGEFTALDALFPDQRVTILDSPFEQRNTVNSVDLELNYELTDRFGIVSKTNYFEGTRSSVQDQDRTAAAGGVFFGDRDGRSVQQEIQLTYNDDRIRGVIGGFFADIDETDIFFSVGGLALRTDTIEKTRNFAFFGEIEAEILPDLTFIGGFRYDNERTTNQTVNSSPLGTTTFQEDAKFSAFLPKVGLVYDVTEDLSIGVTAQRGYRAGGVAANFAGNPDTFDPETTWNFEGAVRSQWLDGRVTANANVFYTQWSDQQVIQMVTAGPPFFFDLEVTNAGKSRLFGGEFELTADLSDNLNIFASGAYVRTKFVDFQSMGQDFSGNEFNEAPRFTAALGGTYEFQNGFFVSADASYTGSSYSDIANTIQNDARFLVNGRVGYRDENFEVFGFVRNLFDNDYAIRRNVSGPNLVVEPGEPMTLGIIGQVSF
ncbi:MAG: TonB-dependent receptor [Pseudomonadota bacterium]